MLGTDRSGPSIADPNADRRLLERLIDQHVDLEFVARTIGDLRMTGGLPERAAAHERADDRWLPRITTLLDSLYHERYEADPSSWARQAVLAITSQPPGAARRRAYLERVRDVHRQSVALIDSLQPALQHAAVRETIERFRADLQAELDTLSRRSDGR
ncbi:MAG: hypothetical protein ACOY71_07705 [Gemmatimonadota bacterium]